ncbi:MAG: hypothetical protein JWQ81_2618 [Amycolatopsis sp.]|uniref:hypothetical protein n=1 Tax=Amycolatopsis sp. TaxID=37632 RepID=UPI002616A6C1|nr:hypothetical protein [Amycolatopsis sp.]MCU1681879.1 hypothetical protein [Amycolatopsis sp.]
MGEGKAAAGFGEATLSAIRRTVVPRRLWLIVITVLAGVLGAIGGTVGAQPDVRTLGTVVEPAQSLMSVVVPLLGILLIRDLRGRPARLAPTLVAAILVAAVIGALGVVVCVGVLAAAPLGMAQNAWQNVGMIAVGSVLVQLVAQLVGTGLGLLLRSAAVAFVASIALPLGLYFLLGNVDGLHPAQAWLAPFASVRNLLSGHMSAVAWAQWLVILLIGAWA